jgi:hypothetical protein
VHQSRAFLAWQLLLKHQTVAAASDTDGCDRIPPGAHSGAKYMMERAFRIILGALLPAGLYLKWPPLVWTLIGIPLLQGVTNRRIPQGVVRLRYGAQVPVGVCCSIGSLWKNRLPGAPGMCQSGLKKAVDGLFQQIVSRDGSPDLYGFETRRTAGSARCGRSGTDLRPLERPVLDGAVVHGFALFGAGLSGMYPMMLGLKQLGFR